MKINKLSLLVLVLLALFTGISWGANQRVAGQRQPNFTSFSHGDSGVGLLYDTLRLMRYPVSILYQPVGNAVSVNDVVIMVQPSRPRLNDAMAEDILFWVQRGGRLIYLENSQTTIMDRALWGEYFTEFGSLRWYSHGMGEVLVGRANLIINANLMEDSTYGEGIALVLSEWNPERIYFAEYYHGFRREPSGFQMMPEWVQLAAYQVIIAIFAIMWHYGKRFGSPIPYYEEVERKENEQVMALARLYKRADRRS